ncbi:MAG: fatty acid desaturase [Acidobacteria bacterium]|nr:MAG: fatty acid desaturase [Acidobacteriota bacterium]
MILIAGRLHALGVVLHDVVHMPPGQKSPTIRLIELLAGYPIGTTVEAMRYHHLRHHCDLGLHNDPYLKTCVGESRLRFWIMTLRYFLLVPLWVLRGVIGAVAAYLPGLRGVYGRIFLQDLSGEDLTPSRELLACACEDRWQTLFYVCVGFAVALRPAWMTAYYLLPLVVAGYLAGVRLLFEHVQKPSTERSRRAILHFTRHHHLGWMGKLLLTPHNVGYHLIHHLHPQASLGNLPKIQEWYERSGTFQSEMTP